MMMRENASSRRTKSPWHLWPIGVFFVFLNVEGAYDYVMCLTLNRGYFSSKGYTATQIAYFTDYPIVPRFFWTISIAGVLVGLAFLLLRSRWATPIVVISVAAQLCLDLLTFGFRNRWQALGPWISLFDILILLLTFGLFVYCRSMARRGVLR